MDGLFTDLGDTRSCCLSVAIKVLAYDVIGDVGYTARLEHTSASVNFQPRT